MNTPKNQPFLRIGLSRTSGSIKKRSSILQPTSASTSNSAANTTPNSSTFSHKTPLKKAVLNKKKLVFAAKNSHESDEEDQNAESLDIEALEKLVKMKRKKLAVLEKHQAEKAELIDVTEKWKQAGLEAMDNLRKFVNPPRSDEEILDSFKIPHNFFL